MIFKSRSFRPYAVILLLAFGFKGGLSAESLRNKKPEPVWPEAGRVGLFPRSGTPADKLFVLDAFGLDNRTKTLVNTAQGIINRDQPRVYLFLEKPGQTAAAGEDTSFNHDRRWLEWLVASGYIKQTERINSVDQYLKMFNIKRAVIVDPEFPNSLNIAAMIGSLNDAVVAYPEHIEKYDLEVVEDLRGRWSDPCVAYDWAFENLWPKMNHDAVAFLGPVPELSHLRDYLVAKKIFTFWVGGQKDSKDPDRERANIAEILAQMPVNIPCLGYPWAGHGVGIGEEGGVRLLSEYGKFLVPTDWKANLSVWTGIGSKYSKLTQPDEREIEFDESKAYVVFTVTDGDNLNAWYDYFPSKDWWESDLRQQIPIGWSIGPTLLDLQPALFDYYYSSMSKMDSFGIATSGVGYMDVRHFGDGFNEQDRQKVREQFYQLTDEYMKRLDSSWLWTFKEGGPGSIHLQEYAEYIPSLKAIFSGYGTGVEYEKGVYQYSDTVIFHDINDKCGPDDVKESVLRQFPDQRPAFVNISFVNWGNSLQTIKDVADALSEDCVLVRPDELRTLYLQSR